MEPSGACWGLLRFFEVFCPKNRFWAVICIGIGTPPDKRPLAAIETLAREKPTQLMAQLRAVWPQVQQALDAGHTLRLIHPATDVMLTDTAKQAVQFSASWRAQQNQPAPGPDGRVLFAFGAGLPTVVCAPLRVCLIELQAGERLVGEPQIGDSVRWNVAPATYGKGDENLFGSFLYNMDHGVPVVAAGGYIEKNQLIGALPVIFTCNCNRVSGIDEVYELDTFDDSAAGDIKTWDYSFSKHYCMSALAFFLPSLNAFTLSSMTFSLF